MGIFTKKKAKQESGVGDEVSDAWLMGAEDEGNDSLGLESLDSLDSLGSGPEDIDDALANAAPPARPSASPSDATPTPVSNPEPSTPTDSAEGWHLPQLSEVDADEQPDSMAPIPGSVQDFEPPELDRRDHDPAPVPLSTLEANADFLAVDLPDVETPAEPEKSPSGPTGPQADTLLEILGLTSGSSWIEIRETHQELMKDHDESTEADPSRAALGRAIRREMNTAYAALRLLAVD